MARHGKERPPPHQLTPRFESELGPGGGLLESRPKAELRTLTEGEHPPDLPSGQTALPNRSG